MLRTLLNIQPGMTTVIGSGGKTTLLRTLGTELASMGKNVILCTTTHILPFDGIPCVTDHRMLESAMETEKLICFGTPLPNGKLTAPACPMERLLSLADHVLVEGDGSKHLPLKAHLLHEPVIPQESNQTLCVVGLSGVGQPVFRSVHRPEQFARLTGLALTDPASPEAVAKALKAEALGDVYLLNQADLPGCRESGLELKRSLPNAHILSLRTGEVYP